MTDQIRDEIAPTDDEHAGVSRRRMFIAGAGIAGAAALAKAGTAAAADGENVEVGGDYDSDTATSFNNTDATVTDPGTPGAEALVGTIEAAGNGSHAVRGSTNGVGHAVAGTVPAANADNAVAATWGKHDNGQGAGVGGVNGATDVPLAGPARGVEGIVLEGTNGSHAVYGSTNGGGHSIAGDTPEDALGPDGDGVNTVAATWGIHRGTGAGIGGVSLGGYGGEFVGATSAVRMIPSDGVAEGAPTEDTRLVGELYVDGVGDLYYNTADGANFTKLNNQGGITLFDDAQRAFDSREEEADPANTNKGRFSDGEIREIDLGEFTDLPEGASGAVINLTAADAEGLGFATVFNGDTADDDRPNASSINWIDTTDTIANGIVVKVSDTNTVKVYTRTATEIIIDVVGSVS